ncbi:MAG: darcynin family protein [Actinomycetota bacterium]
MATEYCYVVSIKANPCWLALDRSTRDEHWDKVRDICLDYDNRVTFRYYDADAFHAQLSDMIICETSDPLDYHHLWDRIKDTAIFASGHYTITDVRSGIKGVSHG